MNLRRPRFLIVLLLSVSSYLYAQDCPATSAEPLRVGVLPVLNTLPTFVAQQQGFFADAGVTVEVVPLESARDRAIALQTGQIDVANSDAVATLLQVAAGDALENRPQRRSRPQLPLFLHRDRRGQRPRHA